MGLTCFGDVFGLDVSRIGHKSDKKLTFSDLNEYPRTRWSRAFPRFQAANASTPHAATIFCQMPMIVMRNQVLTEPT